MYAWIGRQRDADKGMPPYLETFHTYATVLCSPSHTYAMVSRTIPCLWDGARELCKLSNRLKVFMLKTF